eukprot:12892344-Prorocentrum_lima.AAC.1
MKPEICWSTYTIWIGNVCVARKNKEEGAGFRELPGFAQTLGSKGVTWSEVEALYQEKLL